MLNFITPILALALVACNLKSAIEIKGSLELEKPENIAYAEIIVSKNGQQVLDLKLNAPNFKLALEPNSIYTVTFAAPEHESLESVLFTENESAEIAVSLAKTTHQVLKQPFLIGSFNGFNPQQAVPMHENGEGKWIAQVPVKNGEVQYQLMGVTPDQRPVVGTQQDSFDYYEAGYFTSVIKTDKPMVDIVFTADTAKPNLKSELKSDNELLAARAKAYVLLANNRSALTGAYIQQYLSQSETLRIDWNALTQPLITALHETSDLNTKGILMTAWLDLMLNGYQDVVPESVSQTITDLGALHPIWGLNAYSVFAAMDVLTDAATKIEFLSQMSSKHENARVRESATYYGFVVSDEALNTEKRQFFYDKLLAEFPQSQFVEYAKYQFDPKNKVQSGTIAPDFSVASLDGKAIYTNAQFSGKYVMLDFWATWCGPCLQEMDELHAAYNEFKSEKFEILSLSFDQTKEDVVSFRKDRYPMPWLHTFVDGGFENELAQRYEVSGIPKPILINPEGKIVAMGIQLRGANLRKTLSRFLN